MLQEEKANALLDNFSRIIKKESSAFLLRTRNAGCSVQESVALHNTCILENAICIFLALHITATGNTDFGPDFKIRFLSMIDSVYDTMEKSIKESLPQDLLNEIDTINNTSH